MVRGLQTILALILLLSSLSVTADDDWRAVPELTLTGVSGFVSTSDGDFAYDQLATTFEVEFRTRSNRWHTSLFVDYRASTSRSHRDQLNVGGSWRIDADIWDVTAWLFANQSPGRSDKELLAVRVRRVIKPGHKIGMESVNVLGSTHSSFAALGYYGTLDERLSVNVIAGRSTDNGPDLATRIELSWSVF